RELQTRLGITTVFVTHDQVEAATVADRIALLLGGSVEQVGAPRDFYTAPTTLNVARFFGWQVIERGKQMIAFRPERAHLRRLNGGPPTDEELIGRGVAVCGFCGGGRCPGAPRQWKFVRGRHKRWRAAHALT